MTNDEVDDFGLGGIEMKPSTRLNFLHVNFEDQIDGVIIPKNVEIEEICWFSEETTKFIDNLYKDIFEKQFTNFILMQFI
jgi:hypothetical protein